MDEEQLRRPMSTADIAGVSEEENMDRGNIKEAHASKAVESQVVQLLQDHEIDELRSRWNTIQTGFVDEPRTSVEQADALVAEVMKRIAQMFAEQRANLDKQWADHEDVSTEDLRVTLQRYRSFFNRLLAL
jgi:hypothetical protein